MDKKKFDYEAFKKEAAERLKNGGSVLGKDGVEGFPINSYALNH